MEQLLLLLQSLSIASPPLDQSILVQVIQDIALWHSPLCVEGESGSSLQDTNITESEMLNRDVNKGLANADDVTSGKSDEFCTGTDNWGQKFVDSISAITNNIEMSSLSTEDQVLALLSTVNLVRAVCCGNHLVICHPLDHCRTPHELQKKLKHTHASGDEEQAPNTTGRKAEQMSSQSPIDRLRMVCSTEWPPDGRLEELDFLLTEVKVHDLPVHSEATIKISADEQSKSRLVQSVILLCKSDISANDFAKVCASSFFQSKHHLCLEEGDLQFYQAIWHKICTNIVMQIGESTQGQPECGSADFQDLANLWISFAAAVEKEIQEKSAAVSGDLSVTLDRAVYCIQHRLDNYQGTTYVLQGME